MKSLENYKILYTILNNINLQTCKFKDRAMIIDILQDNN